MIEMEPVEADPALLRRAFGCFSSGVTAVCDGQGSPFAERHRVGSGYCPASAPPIPPTLK
jgi:hypothetical protein